MIAGNWISDRKGPWTSEKSVFEWVELLHLLEDIWKLNTRLGSLIIPQQRKADWYMSDHYICAALRDKSQVSDPDYVSAGYVLLFFSYLLALGRIL